MSEGDNSAETQAPYILMKTQLSVMLTADPK